MESRQRANRRRARRAVALAPAALSLLATAPSAAHEVGLSRGEYAAERDGLMTEVAFAQKELSGLVAGLDADHDGALSPAEIEAGRGALEGAVVGRIKVTGDGAPCPGKLGEVALLEQDGIRLRAHHGCGRRPREVTVSLALLEDLPFGHRHLVRAHSAGGEIDLVRSSRAASFSFALPADTAAPPAPSPGDRVARWALAGWPLALLTLAVTTRAASRRAAALGAGAMAIGAGLGLIAVSAFAPSGRALSLAVAASLVYAGVNALAGPARVGWSAAPFAIAHGLLVAAAVRGGAIERATVITAAAALGLAGALGAAKVVTARPRALAALGAAVAAAGIIAGAITLRG